MNVQDGCNGEEPGGGGQAREAVPIQPGGCTAQITQTQLNCFQTPAHGQPTWVSAFVAQPAVKSK